MNHLQNGSYSIQVSSRPGAALRRHPTLAADTYDLLDTRQLVIPRTRTRYGDRSFSVHGPTVRNSLPYDLRSTDTSLNTFKNRLKHFCLTLTRISASAASANLGYISVIIIIIIIIITNPGGMEG